MGSVCCHRSLCSGDWPSTLSLPSRSLQAGKSKWFGWVAPFASCSLRQVSDLCPSHAHPSLLPFSLRGCSCQPCSHRPCLCSATGPDSPRRRREELGREVLPEGEGLHSRRWLSRLVCGSMAMVEKVVLVVLTGEQGEHSALWHSTLTRS